MTSTRSLLAFLISVAALVSLGLAVSAHAAGFSEATIPYKVEYQGTYTYHEDAQIPGEPTLVSDESLVWNWLGTGRVPEVGNFTSLKSRLGESGSISTSGGTTPSERCTIGPGTNASTPLQLSSQNSGLYVGYHFTIPSVGVTAIGNQQGCDVFDGDALLCDQNGCAGVCPGAPVAVTTDRFQPEVMDAFSPQVPAAVYSGDWGATGGQFDLPTKTGDFTTSCLNGVTETVTISIVSSVTIDRPPDNFAVNFPDGTFPDFTKPIDLIPTTPSGPSAPIIFGPKSPTTLPPEASPPATPISGVIKILCPKRDRRCKGSIAASDARLRPAKVGKGSFSLAGGTTELTDVGLSQAAEKALTTRRRLAVRLSIRTTVLPTHKVFTSAKTLTLRL